jgi:hypothetical protein
LSFVRRRLSRCPGAGLAAGHPHPNETVVLETIRDLGLELRVMFN